MNDRKLVALLLAVCGLLGAASAAAAADTRRSHLPVGASEPGDGQLEERLRPAQDLSLLRALARRVLSDPKQFLKLSDRNKQLLRNLLEDRNVQQLLKDPEVAKQLARELQDNPNLTPEQLELLRKSAENISPADLEKLAQQVGEHPKDFNLDDKQRDELERLARALRDGKLSERTRADLARLLNQMRENPNFQREDLDALRRALPDFDPRPMIPPDPPPGVFEPLPRPDGSGTPPQPGPGPGEVLPPPAPHGPPENPANTTIANWLSTAADWLQDGEDGGLLDAAGGLLHGLVSEDANGKSTLDQGTDLFDSLAKVRDWLPLDGAGSWLEQLAPPSLSGGNQTPAVPSAPSLPGTGSVSFGAGDTEGLARLAIWGIVLGGLAFVLWKLGGLYRDSAARRGLPGGWPVDPGAVATRGDLVRAFEHLALRLLGLDARHRNHLDLADRLGGTPEAGDAARRQAAGHLARLYELARYAPDDEPLSEAEMAAARRDLSFLAGAAPA